MSLFSVELPAQPGPAPLKHSGDDMMPAFAGNKFSPKHVTPTSANANALRVAFSMLVACKVLSTPHDDKEDSALDAIGKGRAHLEMF